MKKIGVVGAQGFLGKTLCKYAQNHDFEVIEITRKTFSKQSKQNYDFLINSATPSAKFWAQNNPYSDFQKTVELTANLVYNWNYQKFIQISTITAKEIISKHPYAINKRAAEIIALHKDSLIVRLGALYGDRLKKGPLYDLLNSKKIFVDLKSEYNYISTDFVANWILNNLERKGTVELGAQDTLSLEQIAKKLNLDIEYQGKYEKIYTQDIEKGMPKANEVWNFINNYQK